jgi:hypothetical protein
MAYTPPSVPNNNHTKDIFGLGNDYTTPVDVSGLPTSVQTALNNTRIPIKTAGDLMLALTQIKDVSVVSQIQNMLYNANLYPTGTVKNINDAMSGFMDTNTTSALTKVVKQTAETQTPFGHYLTAASYFGQATATINQAAGVGTNLIGIEHPAPVTVDAGLHAEAEALLGHDVSPEDYARFRAFYDNLYTQASRGTVLAQAKANAASSQFGTPQQLAGAYATQVLPQQNPVYSPGESATAAEAQQNHAQQYNNELGQAKTAANAYAAPIEAAAASTTPGTYDYTAQPSALSGPKDAADQFLRTNYGSQVTNQNALLNYGKLIAFMKGDGSLPTS